MSDKGTLLSARAPRLHDLVLDLAHGAAAMNAGLLEKKIIGGLALEQWYPELGPGASLWCATEVTTRKDMDAAAEALVSVTASVTDAEPVLAAKG